MRTLLCKILCAAGIGSLFAATNPWASAQTFVSEFETDFDGWADQWHKESETGTDGVATHSTERGLFNEFQGDFNTFEVKAAIDTANPEVQADFETIGATDSAEGWVPFNYNEAIFSPTGDVWVALGIRVAFETHRDYWIDRVVVTTTEVPEPAGAALLMLGLAGVVLVRHVERTR